MRRKSINVEISGLGKAGLDMIRSEGARRWMLNHCKQFISDLNADIAKCNHQEHVRMVADPEYRLGQSKYKGHEPFIQTHAKVYKDQIKVFASMTTTQYERYKHYWQKPPFQHCVKIDGKDIDVTSIPDKYLPKNLRTSKRAMLTYVAAKSLPQEHAATIRRLRS